MYLLSDFGNVSIELKYSETLFRCRGIDIRFWVYKYLIKHKLYVHKYTMHILNALESEHIQVIFDMLIDLKGIDSVTCM